MAGITETASPQAPCVTAASVGKEGTGRRAPRPVAAPGGRYAIAAAQGRDREARALASRPALSLRAMADPAVGTAALSQCASSAARQSRREALTGTVDALRDW